MRSTLRAAGLLALVVAAITCTDAPTGPHGSGAPDRSLARVGMAPSFSTGAADAYRALEAFGLAVSSVRVRLRATDGSFAKDTSVAFPAAQDTLQLDLSVPIQGSEQTFTALLDLLDANGVVLFSGTQLVTARAASLPSASPRAIALEYAGPGHTARAMSVTPSSQTISASSVIALSASARDSAGNDVPDLLVHWTSSDDRLVTVTGASSTHAELRGAGARGTVTVTATSPTGLTASTRLVLVPAATRLVVIGGANQSAVAGHGLPDAFTVEVQANDGGAVPNVVVAFRAASAGGTVTVASVTTDSTGRASTAMSVGRSAGSYTFEARADSLAPVTLTATATAPPATEITLVSGDAQSDSAGASLAQPFTVSVSDEFGAPVAGAIVAWTRIAGSGSLGATQTRSDSNGFASTTYALGTTPGTDSVRATLVGVMGGGASVVFTATSSPRATASTFVLIQALPPKTPVGLPPANALLVQLADASGNPVQARGVDVTATGVVAANHARPFTLAATSDAAGLVTFVFPAYVGAKGSATITLTSPGFTPLALAPISFTSGPVAALDVVTQPSPSATSGAVMPVQPVIQLVDAGGNAVSVAGVQVTAFVASGGGVLGGTSTVSTDTAGVATFTDLSITASPGQKTLGFSSPTLIDALASPLVLANAAAALDSVSGFAPPQSASSTVRLSTFKLRLVDAAHQTVARANIPVTVRATSFGTSAPFAPLAGGVTRLTDANGVATFDDVSFNTAAGAYALSARADSAVVALPVLTLVDSLTLFTGPASSISVSTGARVIASGASLSAGVVTFQVRDAFGATTPSRSYTIGLSTAGNCTIQPAYRTVNTGVTSEASVPIDLGGGVGGCIVSATTSGVAVPARAQIAVAPSNATHVWFGASGSGASAWEIAAGWEPIPPMMAGSWPADPSSDAYVPFWSNQYTSPQLMLARLVGTGPLAIGRLRVDSMATVDLGGFPLIVAGDSAGGLGSVAASGAQVVNGRVLLYGAGALVSGGTYDQLSIGDTLGAGNFCASNSIAARLRNVVVRNTLDVHCKLAIDSAVTAGVVNSYSDATQPGWITLASPSSALAAGTGNFAGDSLVIVGGRVDVSGAATLSGAVTMSSGTLLRVQGNLTLGAGAAVDLSSGADITIAGACSGRTTNGATLTGGGSVNASAITASTCTP